MLGLEKLTAHHRMASWCLTYLQFSCFVPDMPKSNIIQCVKQGEYALMSYVEDHWLEHTKGASKLSDKKISDLEQPLRLFLDRWACPTSGNELEGRIGTFGLENIEKLCPDLCQILYRVVLYKSQSWSHETCNGIDLTLAETTKLTLTYAGSRSAAFQ